ncbi:39S ribosomal protein L32, mitochondrial [Protopterus annectens]|uniref:39S ribosomal protein L32, mitochondrial n=1 Tax=Protopterus annectens TaxID=7888 RepID=UPI001CFC3165|nr:39S ribosomal protein L32, mitochondrial [Protopterus annectens]
MWLRGTLQLLHGLRTSLVNFESWMLSALGVPRYWAPAVAVQNLDIPCNPEDCAHEGDGTGFLDSIFWMAAPKKRRTIEVNRTRRRDPRKLEKIKDNIDVCSVCGHLKLKHVLCGFCYEKVRRETAIIRGQIRAQEGGPFKAPSVETVVLYEGEKPTEADEGKRIVERSRKRPSWFMNF